MATMPADRARRIALAAQGFGGRGRPAGRVDVRHYRRVLDHVGALQLDSVNVVSRSHYLPVYARIGPYDRAGLDRWTVAGGEVFEYWGHAASLMPMEMYPLFRHRMAAMRPWRSVQRLEEEHPGYLEEVYREVAQYGPVTISDLAEPGKRTGPWWGYGRGKIALEWLFATGRIASYRTPNFGRLYDVPERVIPERLLETPAPDRDEAYRELLLRSCRHLGIGTLHDLVDYYRLEVRPARAVLAGLVDEGLLEEVEVAGWSKPAFRHPEARAPRRLEGRALLSPFDSLIWERDRTERLFGFRYRIEIYVPKERRVHGYYVLPFLLDGELVARVDLKADRKGGRLIVQAAHIEEGADPARVATELAEELHIMAGWLDLDDVGVVRRGDLAGRLQRAVRSGPLSRG